MIGFQSDPESERSSRGQFSLHGLNIGRQTIYFFVKISCNGGHGDYELFCFILFLLRTLEIDKEFHYESFLTQHGRNNIHEFFYATLSPKIMQMSPSYAIFEPHIGRQLTRTGGVVRVVCCVVFVRCV